MVKVTKRSNTFCLAFGSEAELTWESLWLQVAGRFELLPGGEAMADAIYAGSAIFTYVDADGDSVQLVCEADLAIAVRSASVSSPPTLRLLVELARTGGSAGEADRSGSGEGGEGGAGGWLAGWLAGWLVHRMCVFGFVCLCLWLWVWLCFVSDKGVNGVRVRVRVRVCRWCIWRVRLVFTQGVSADACPPPNPPCVWRA